MKILASALPFVLLQLSQSSSAFVTSPVTRSVNAKSNSALFDNDGRLAIGGVPIPTGGLKETASLQQRLEQSVNYGRDLVQQAQQEEAPIVEAEPEEVEPEPVKHGFDTIALHGGYTPDTDVAYGMGFGAPRGVPLHRTTPYVFKDSEHAANLFALKELGNIYSRLMNPTNHVLESRYAMLEGAHEMAGLSVASGTNGKSKHKLIFSCIFQAQSYPRTLPTGNTYSHFLRYYYPCGSGR